VSVEVQSSTRRESGERLAALNVLVSAPPALSGKLETGLTQLGCAVATIPAAAAPRDREAAAATVAVHAERLGGLDALVHAPHVADLAPRGLVEIDAEVWARWAEAPIWEALVLFQAAYAGFGPAGGSIVAALPSLALTGAADLVPLAAAAEGIRQLAKSAARAWGCQGTRVNCLTLPIDVWGVLAARPVPNRYGASLPGVNAPGELAGAVAMLISPFARGVTGATVGLDRGTVLAP